MANNLPNIDPIIFEKILSKLRESQPDATKFSVYNKLTGIKQVYGNTISTRIAAFLLASDLKIPIYRFLSENELDKIRDIRSRTLLQSNLQVTIPKVVERKEPSRKRKVTNSVFIVHGRDLKAARELSELLTELGLRPIILSEKASGGSKTLIEKFERYKNVGFTFVLLTPDDAGYCQKDAEKFFSFQKNQHPRVPDIPRVLKEGHSGLMLDNVVELFEHYMKERARQNVILELGYFMGYLGRSRVCCLRKGNVEQPSDIHGIMYIPFKNSVKQVKKEIIKELKAAKYPIKQ